MDEERLRAEVQALQDRVAVLELTLRVICDHAGAGWKPMQASGVLSVVAQVAAVMLGRKAQVPRHQPAR